MPEDEIEASILQPEKAPEVGPTEARLAREQAEAMASRQPLAPPAADSPQSAEQDQGQREQAAEEQRAWEARQQDQAQTPPSWLQAPQQEGILSHPTPEASPASPGKEQHEQALAEEMGEPHAGMKKTITTKTQLGAVVTLDGAYVVPRYQTVIKETPMQEKVSYMRQKAQEQGSERQAQPAPASSQARGRDNGRERDRER